MGKGDIKSKKGKINKGSYGNSRQKKKKNLSIEQIEVLKVAAERRKKAAKKVVAEKKPAAKKAAAKKPAAKKAAAKKPAAKKAAAKKPAAKKAAAKKPAAKKES
jgi:ribosomal small subunit protein bTHX